MQTATFIKATGSTVRRTVTASLSTRQTKPSTKASGKWTSNMDKVLKLGMMDKASTKAHSSKERKLAGHVTSKTVMFMKVISSMESSMVKANTISLIPVKPTRANL